MPHVDDILRVIPMKHLEKGSPVSPVGQEQIGLWLRTLHIALVPHVPGHGSIHFILRQALSLVQSELTTHSGLQFGGEPMYPKRQEQTACSFITLHWLLGPHGDG